MKLDWPKLALRWKEALGNYKYVLLVIGLGALLMALPPAGQRDGDQEAAQTSAEGFDLEAFEEKMERALSQVEGAGAVRVVLTLDSGGRQILAQDQERDREGAAPPPRSPWGGVPDSRRWSLSRRWPRSFEGRWWSAPAGEIPGSSLGCWRRCPP